MSDPNAILLEFKDKMVPEEVVRIEKNLHAMIEQGAFSVRNGRVVLHFDHLGNLQIIAFDFIKWKRERAV